MAPPRFRCRVFLNRFAMMVVAGLSYTSWSSFYAVCTQSTNLHSPGEAAVFTAVMLAILALLASWYVSHEETLRARAKLAMTQPLLQLEREEAAALLTAAVLEKSFGNLSDAMGYTIVEVWVGLAAGLALHWLAALALAAAAGIAVLLAISAAQERLPPSGSGSRGGLLHAWLDLLSTVWIGSFAWFLSVPAYRALQNAFRIGDGQAGELWMWVFALVGSAAWVVVSGVCASLCCYAKHADDSDSEANAAKPLRTLVCEKVEPMLNHAAFYTSARLAKTWVMTEWAPRGYFPVIAWTTMTIFVVCLLEQLLKSVALPDTTSSAALRLKLETHIISLTARTFTWIDAAMVCAWYQGKRTPDRWEWMVIGLVTQGEALLLEHLRVQWNHGHVLCTRAGAEGAESDEEELGTLLDCTGDAGSRSSSGSSGSSGSPRRSP